MIFTKKHMKRIVPTILLIVGIIVAFWNFIQDNTRRIENQNEEYLYELTTQRAISIDRMISENLTFINTTAHLYGRDLSSPGADIAVIREYEENTVFDMLRFVDADGDNYTSKGVMSNLSDRAYFQAGMRGESGVTYVLESRVTGEKQIGFYAPVYYEGEIIGVMVGFYGEAYITQLLEYDLFGYEGEAWLCTRDGTVLGSTVDMRQDNYFSYMREADKSTDEELEQIENAFDDGNDLSFAYMEGEDKAAGYAVSLTQADWVLIRNFPPSASGQILKKANGEGVSLIAELLVMFLIYGIFIAIGIVIEHNRMRQANRNANDISTGVSRLFDKFITLDLQTGEYSYIGGEPTDKKLPETGSYAEFCTSFFGKVPDENLRKEAEAFFDTGNLKALLADSDRVSMRVQADAGDVECFTFNFVVIEREGKVPSRLLVVCQDVTDLHHKEKEEQDRLQHALDTAEQASRAKTEFLFNMSHDLRTPMNAIIGYTKLAKSKDIGAEEMRGFIEKIDSSSRHLLSLINDILEMSRIESGKIDLEPVETDLISVMKEAEEMFATQMAGKHISFSVETAGIKEQRVLCDRNRLNRILLNLISNACKFTDSGGTVAVVLEQTETADDRGTYELHVKDTGIGMNPDFVSKLFTPFERERTSTVSKIQGTGLGLSITKKIVDLMGGTIDVNTEQGIGTEFIVRLRFPIVKEIEEACGDTAQEQEMIDFGQMRLLLVEDNMVNREIASMILKQWGFLLETAENGKAAVDMVARSEPGYYDVILMDIQMPEMDGYTATRRIRSLKDVSLAAIPIIAMTANAFQEDVQTAFDAGMNGHIAKPLDIDKMKETLMRVLTEHKNNY